jgi:hypothetical protein
MKTIAATIGLAVALALPAGALAKPHPDQADKRAAKAECKNLRGKSSATREAFETRFRNFGACVRKAAADEAREEQNARRNAAQECREERETSGRDKFADDHGTNDNKRNAFGKCVSEKAKEHEQQADEQDKQEASEFKNAAKECAHERETLGEDEFADEYGTNDNKRNAFGKCVSEKAQDGE